MTLKSDRIIDAYSQMRISGLTVNPSPEDEKLALNRLEDMAAEFESRNICTGYNFEETPDPNSPTNVPREFWQMFSTNLAIRLVDFNKVIPPLLIAQASQSLSNASSISARKRLKEVLPPRRMPLGSGNTLRTNRYNRFNRPVAPPPSECETNDMFIDDINNYTETFDAYLDAGEIIDSFELTADAGLSVQGTPTNTDTAVNYQIKAVNTVTTGAWQQVKIVMTSSTGRVETRFINFSVSDNRTVGSN